MAMKTSGTTNSMASRTSCGRPPMRYATTWMPPVCNVLGLIFLKYISDAFEGSTPLEAERGRALTRTRTNTAQRTPSGKRARWPLLKGNAHQPTNGKLVDDAMVAMRRDNPSSRVFCP